MVSTLGETLGTTGSESRSAEHAAAAELVCALECDRPAALSTRHRLAEIDAIELGRGNRRSVARGDRALRLTIPDARMSGTHARIEQSFGRWVFEDCGSKNGSLINGEPTTRRELVDGDLIEVGHTLFLWRAEVERDGGPDDVDLEGIEIAAGTVTLDADLDRELEKLARLATSEVPLLLYGESGTGKEVLARAFHQRSGRRGDLVAINCGAIPESLIESELFGHRKGAFSGAVSDSIGLVRAADGGTLFLDEIADLPLASQAVLLRVLQEREVRPVGGTRSIAVDIRLVAATHQDLSAMVAGGQFRDDLYARVSGFRIAVPPLRERLADLGMLIGSLLVKLAAELDREVPRLDVAVARQLFAHRWPLNIRELETTLRAAMVLATDEKIEVEHLPVDLRPTSDAPSPPRPLDDRELAHRDELIALLEEHGGNLSAVSRAVGKDRKQIHRWLKRYGLDPDTFRS